jgi:hypothetical protein
MLLLSGSSAAEDLALPPQGVPARPGSDAECRRPGFVVKRATEERVKASASTRQLLVDPQHHTSADRLATLTDRKALTDLHSNGIDQPDRRRHGVTRHHHVDAIS